MHDILKLYNQINTFGKDQEMEFDIIQPGEIRYRFPTYEKHCATPKALHGGAIAAFMDAVLGVSALSLSCEQQKLVSTIELKLNFLKPAAPNHVLLGAGKVVSSGNRIIVAEGIITDEETGAEIARGSGTFNAYPIGKSGLV